ncbi:MAG: adenosine kinase [Cyanobacteria bacterium QS_8_64_29]|nr:MAG: adenosine kinase [Cyanobacteria bacterium QS_8_64_29]
MTKTYNVCGLGNALTDIEFEVLPETLQELGIDKGVMTLIEQEHQNAILERLRDRPCKQSCGGSAANTVTAIAQFGGKCFYSCKVANDETGQAYYQDLVRRGIDTNLQHHDPEPGETGKCLVLVTPDADRTMNTYLGITTEFSERELVPEAITNAEYLYIEGYLFGDEKGKQAAIKARDIAREAGSKVAVSLSDLNMVKFCKQAFLDLIGSGIELIFANEDEALQMAETDDIDEAVAHFKQLASSFAITRGAKGVIVYDGQTATAVDSVKVDAIDTVGAGDMFAGAFLYGITHGMSHADAGRFATRAAARLVTSLGPRLDEREAQTLLQEAAVA